MKKRIISPAHLEYGVTGTDCKPSINWLLVSTGMENIGRLSSNRRDSPATSANLPPGMTATNKDINQRVWQVMNLIPKGRVASYGDVAALAGHPGAARQVGRHSVVDRTGCSNDGGNTGRWPRKIADVGASEGKPDEPAQQGQAGNSEDSR